jgi:hypothetical protein
MFMRQTWLTIHRPPGAFADFSVRLGSSQISLVARPWIDKSYCTYLYCMSVRMQHTRSNAATYFITFHQ